MVDEAGGFVAFEPWAAQTPYETWIAPAFHQGSFGDLADEQVEDLAGHPDPNADGGAPRVRRPRLQPRDVLGAHERRPRGTGLPLASEADPRVSTQAGFEIGSAMAINTVAPEDAADELRRALADA